MKSTYREALADLRAAALLSHPDSLEQALQALEHLPGISGNQSFSTQVIQQLIIPAGEIIGQSNTPVDYLTALLHSPLAYRRAVTGAVLLFRYLRGVSEVLPGLDRLAADRRADVRRTLELAAHSFIAQGPQNLLRLAEHYLAIGRNSRDVEIRARQTALALGLLVPLAGLERKRLISHSSVIPGNLHPSINAKLVAVLVALADAGAVNDVFEQLQKRLASPIAESWVICRTLSAGWAAEHRERAEALLDLLEQKTGDRREINRVRQSLQRKVNQ